MPQTKILSNQLSDTGVTPGPYTSANVTIDSAGRITAAANGSGGGGAPGGLTTELQFNNAGAFGGVDDFTYSIASGDLQYLPLPRAAPGNLVLFAPASTIADGGIVDIRAGRAGNDLGVSYTGGRVDVQGGESFDNDGLSGRISAGGAAPTYGGNVDIVAGNFQTGNSPVPVISSGGNVNIEAGRVTGSGALTGSTGGNVTIRSGRGPNTESALYGGDIYLYHGTSLSYAFKYRGDIEIQGNPGAAGQALTSGGAAAYPSWSALITSIPGEDAILTSGFNDAGDGADAGLQGGESNLGVGGAAFVSGGDGITNGGEVNITSGSGATGGSVSISASSSTVGAGANVTVNAGAGTNVNGGVVNISGGPVLGDDIFGGGVALFGANQTGANTTYPVDIAGGGPIDLIAGNAIGQGQGGNISVLAGNSTTGHAGSVSIRGGSGDLTAPYGAITFSVDPLGINRIPLRVYGSSSVTIGVESPATAATAGFPYISSMTTDPTGVPIDITGGHVPMVFNRINNKLWIYNSGWVSVTLT